MTSGRVRCLVKVSEPRYTMQKCPQGMLAIAYSHGASKHLQRSVLEHYPWQKGYVVCSGRVRCLVKGEHQKQEQNRSELSRIQNRTRHHYICSYLGFKLQCLQPFFFGTLPECFRASLSPSMASAAKKQKRCFRAR